MYAKGHEEYRRAADERRTLRVVGSAKADLTPIVVRQHGLRLMDSSLWPLRSLRIVVDPVVALNLGETNHALGFHIPNFQTQTTEDFHCLE
jgi:hypothetical protein